MLLCSPVYPRMWTQESSSWNETILFLCVCFFDLLNAPRRGWWLVVLRKHFGHSDWVTGIPKAFDTLQLSNRGLQKARLITLPWQPGSWTGQSPWRVPTPQWGWLSAASHSLAQGAGGPCAFSRSLLLSNQPSLLGNRSGKRKREEGVITCLPASSDEARIPGK